MKFKFKISKKNLPLIHKGEVIVIKNNILFMVDSVTTEGIKGLTITDKGSSHEIETLPLDIPYTILLNSFQYINML